MREGALGEGALPKRLVPQKSEWFKSRNEGGDLGRLLSASLVLVQEEENQIDVDVSLPKGTQERGRVDR